MKTLMKEKCWGVWGWGLSNGRWTKVPFVGYKMPGKTDVPEMWQYYDDMVKLQKKYRNHEEHKGLKGLSLILRPRENDDDMVLGAIDIDALDKEKGIRNPLEGEILDMFRGTYYEASPSGTGYHILFNMDRRRIPLNSRGEPAYKQKNDDRELEIYIGTATNRYMTLTGKQASESDEITDQTENVLTFIDRYMKKDLRTKVLGKTRERLPDVHYREPLDDGDIKARLKEARKGIKGEEFCALYDSGVIPHGQSHSEADWMLLRHLVYWLGPDPAAIDKAFRASGLMREKWNEMRGSETFGMFRIHTALERFHRYRPFPGVYGDGVCRRELKSEEQITDLIRRVAKDSDHRNDVSVLPMLCGMGKSTAISRIIRQTIEAVTATGNGLLVVTDRTDRLHEYMEPWDSELKTYLDKHSDQVLILDADSVAAGALRERENYPVLLMTTQRFFSLSREEVLTEYLNWANGIRPLVLIDERPEIRTNIDITEAVLGQIKAALGGTFQGIESGIPYALGLLLRDCGNVIEETRNNLTEQHIYRFLWKPDFDSYHAQVENDELDVLNQIGRNRMAMEDAVSARGRSNIFQSIHAILDMEREAGLVWSQLIRREENKTTYSASVNTMTDNRHCIQNIPAKVIILDGTAEISPEYLLDSYDFREDCETKRPLNHLRIRIINLNTTRSKLDRSADYRTMVGRTVRQYVDTENIRDDPNWVLFTYQDHQLALSKQIDAPTSDYFGNIVGRNIYNNAKHIVQVGLNRFPEWVYFRILLDTYRDRSADLAYDDIGAADDPFLPDITAKEEPEKTTEERKPAQTKTEEENLLDTLVDVNEHWKPYSSMVSFPPDMPIDLIKNQSQILDDFARRHSEELEDVMCDSMFAEIEQMIFRGIIRNANCAEDYTYHLFIDIHRYEGLFSRMLDRYVPLGAKIEVVSELPGSALYGLMVRDGAETQTQRMVKWHDQRLRTGDTYSDKDLRIAAGIGSDSSWRKYKSTHKEWLRPMIDAEREEKGIYRKKGNWFY